MHGPVDCVPDCGLGMGGHPSLHEDKTGFEPVPFALLAFGGGHAANCL